jgi:CBS domain-containing membrane protein
MPGRTGDTRTRRGGRSTPETDRSGVAGPRAQPLTVADLMQRDVVSIGPDATVADLIRQLRDHGIGGMPVVDEQGELLGTVSSTDVLWLAGSEDEHSTTFLSAATLNERTVRDIMTPDVFGVRPGAGLGALRRFFARTSVQRALVVDDNRVVGIVTLSDVLGTLVK